MEKVAFHNFAEIRDKTVGRGHFMKDLLSYSPFLNPLGISCPNGNNWWEKAIRITKMTCFAWIRHLGKYRPITVGIIINMC